MSFDNELKEKLNSKKPLNFYRVVVGNDYAIIEGHKGLLYFDENKIQVRLKVDCVNVLGEKLCIVHSQKDEIVIKGHIKEIVFGEAGK